MLPDMNPGQVSLTVDIPLFTPLRSPILAVPRLETGVVLALNDATRGRMIAHHTIKRVEPSPIASPG